MSQHIVTCLSAYRKSDCKVGRITSNEDFKRLARKVIIVSKLLAKSLGNCEIGIKYLMISFLSPEKISGLYSWCF